MGLQVMTGQSPIDNCGFAIRAGLNMDSVSRHIKHSIRVFFNRKCWVPGIDL